MLTNNNIDIKRCKLGCKSQKQDGTGVSALKQGGQLYSDRKKKGDILADQFSSVFTDDASDTHRDSCLEGQGYDPIGPLNITVEGSRNPEEPSEIDFSIS